MCVVALLFSRSAKPWFYPGHSLTGHHTKLYDWKRPPGPWPVPPQPQGQPSRVPRRSISVAPHRTAATRATILPSHENGPALPSRRAVLALPTACSCGGAAGERKEGGGDGGSVGT